MMLKMPDCQQQEEDTCIVLVGSNVNIAILYDAVK